MQHPLLKNHLNLHINLLIVKRITELVHIKIDLNFDIAYWSFSAILSSGYGQRLGWLKSIKALSALPFFVTFRLAGSLPVEVVARPTLFISVFVVAILILC